MRIEAELRYAITAAAKAQPDYNYEQQSQEIKKGVADFLKRRPAVKRKAEVLMRQIDEINAKRTTLTTKLGALLNPFGLYASNSQISANFRPSDLDDPDAVKFVAAGGKLPPPAKRRWKAETVIARLAAAEPKERDAILREYGILWK